MFTLKLFRIYSLVQNYVVFSPQLQILNLSGLKLNTINFFLTVGVIWLKSFEKDKLYNTQLNKLSLN
jgi:hypothetical protein